MIFLDMDGVVADLLWSVYHAWVPYVAGFHQEYPYTAEWRSQNKGKDPAFESWLQGRERWTKGPILYPEFWRGIEPFPWTRNLVRALGSFHVCSNPGRSSFASAAAMGKIKWCDMHLDVDPKRVILTAEKHLLASPGRILIDDHEEHIASWNEAGGTGILFPQPWNAAHVWQSADPVSYIQMKLTEVGYTPSPSAAAEAEAKRRNYATGY